MYITQLIPNPTKDIMHIATMCEVGKLLVNPEPYIKCTHAIIKNIIMMKQLNDEPKTIVTDLIHRSAISSFQGHMYKSDEYNDILIIVSNCKSASKYCGTIIGRNEILKMQVI